LPTLPLPAGTARQAGGCIQPVLLRGRVDHIDGATGELLHRYSTVHEPDGVLPAILEVPQGRSLKFPTWLSGQRVVSEASGCRA
jgi:hypothetical protein